jgi:zinc transport system substrate-binding protein
MNDAQKSAQTRRLPPAVTSTLWVGLRWVGLRWIGLLLLGPLCLAPCGACAAPVKITVSILPQAWFVEQIGGDLVEVSVLVGPGHSPATYEPTPRQMAVLEQADLFLAAGVPFEKGLLPRVHALPHAPVIAGPEPGQSSHHHDTDPHTWLDPAQAMAIADSISAQLQAIAPADAHTFQENCRALKKRLALVDEQAGHILAPYRGRAFIVFHPAFGHFAAAYGLVQVSVETGGHEPGPRHLANVIERARASGLRSVVVQPQFSRKSAETVAEAIEAEIVVLDPLAADYEANLLHLARTLADRFAAEDTAEYPTESPKDGS